MKNNYFVHNNKGNKKIVLSLEEEFPISEDNLNKSDMHNKDNSIIDDKRSIRTIKDNHNSQNQEEIN